MTVVTQQLQLMLTYKSAKVGEADIKKAHFGAVEDPCKKVMGDGSKNDSDRLKDGVQKVTD